MIFFLSHHTLFSDTIWVILQVESGGTLALMQQMVNLKELGTSTAVSNSTINHSNPFANSRTPEFPFNNSVFPHDSTNNKGDDTTTSSSNKSFSQNDGNSTAPELGPSLPNFGNGSLS